MAGAGQRLSCPSKSMGRGQCWGRGKGKKLGRDATRVEVVVKAGPWE